MQRLDVDAMLDELTPEQFAEWMASDRVDPWLDRWESIAQLEATLHNHAHVLACISAGIAAKSSAFKSASDLIPQYIKQDQEPTDARHTLAASEAMMRARYKR